MQEKYFLNESSENLMPEEKFIEERIKELGKKKRKLLDYMKKQRKKYSKAAAEKKAVAEEIVKLQEQIAATKPKPSFVQVAPKKNVPVRPRIKKNLFQGMSDGEAFAKVSSEIKSVSPDDVYPKDLEEEFDNLEKQFRYNDDRDVITVRNPNFQKTIRATKIEPDTSANDGLGSTKEHGVIDLSDGGEYGDDELSGQFE
jgi:uncharacterized protein YoaH (UPF0181 family)